MQSKIISFYFNIYRRQLIQVMLIVKLNEFQTVNIIITFKLLMVVDFIYRNNIR